MRARVSRFLWCDLFSMPLAMKISTKHVYHRHEKALALCAGFFKDRLGSYNGLYYLIAGCSIFIVILWTCIVAAEPIKRMRLRRRRAK